MNLTPRANETAAVVAVLTAVDADGNPVYDDETAMAKAAIKALGVELGKRDWYVMPYGLPGEPGGVNYGPFATRAELSRFAGRQPEGEHGAVLVLGPDRPRGAGDDEVNRICVCGHVAEIHVVKNIRGGKVSAPGVCGRYNTRKQKCECNQYEARR